MRSARLIRPQMEKTGNAARQDPLVEMQTAGVCAPAVYSYFTNPESCLAIGKGGGSWLQPRFQRKRPARGGPFQSEDDLRKTTNRYGCPTTQWSCAARGRSWPCRAS